MTPAEKFKQAQDQRLGDQIKDIYDSLNVVGASDITSLPEEVFVNSYLPFFAGLTVPPEVNLGTWSGIAGNPYKPVHVVDKKGVVLYTIPPLFDREALDINKTDKRASPMQHVMVTYEQYMRISPVRARNYLNQELSARNITTSAPPNVLKNLKTWNDIFARYKMPLIAEEVPGTQTNDDTVKPELEFPDGIL